MSSARMHIGKKFRSGLHYTLKDIRISNLAAHGHLKKC